MQVLKKVFINVVLSCLFFVVNAQSITTVVPFLNLMPDARTASMADAGVAAPADANSISINPAKLSFLKSNAGLSASYNPWLKRLNPGMNLSYLSAYLKVDKQSAIGMSIRYLSLGSVQYINLEQQDLGSYKPSEYAVDAAYSRRFGDNFSIGTAFRYVFSNAGVQMGENDQATQTLKSIAADVSAFYTHPLFLFNYDADLSAGINISNIAPPITFQDDITRYHLPTNLKFGLVAIIHFDPGNQLSGLMDLNQPLVPGSTPLKVSSGLEYLYRNSFAIRAGYLFEAGAQRSYPAQQSYLSLGTGLKYNGLQLDLAYLPTSIENSPLAGSLRFTLMFTFDGD
jgi:hypothetical protein